MGYDEVFIAQKFRKAELNHGKGVLDNFDELLWFCVKEAEAAKIIKGI